MARLHAWMNARRFLLDLNLSSGLKNFLQTATPSRITTPSLTGLRNRAVRKRTRMLPKEEFPNGVVTELTTVGTRGCLFRDGERRIARCAQYVSVAWHG